AWRTCTISRGRAKYYGNGSIALPRGLRPADGSTVDCPIWQRRSGKMSATMAATAASLTITPLTGSIGAEVEGVDLSRDLEPAVAQQIREAFYRYFVLVFRKDGERSAEEQERLAALFGEPQPLAVFQFLGAHQPSIRFDPDSKIAPSAGASAPKPTASVPPKELRAIGIAGEFDGWHSDSTFTPWLPRAAVLRAEVIPP